MTKTASKAAGVTAPVWPVPRPDGRRYHMLLPASSDACALTHAQYTPLSRSKHGSFRKRPHRVIPVGFLVSDLPAIALATCVLFSYFRSTRRPPALHSHSKLIICTFVTCKTFKFSGHKMSFGSGTCTRAASNGTSVRSQAWAGTPQANFAKWVKTFGGIQSPAGTLATERRYILIGAGFGNLYLAWLLNLGGAIVTIIEANDHVGGRAAHSQMQDGSLAPMGMMRFSTSNALWIELLHLCGYEFKTHFPNPGRVPTILSFKGINDVWNSGAAVPHGYETVNHGFSTFLEEGLKRNGKHVLCSWNKIKDLLADYHINSSALATKEIQGWITVFRGESIGSAFQLIFKPHQHWDVPGGKHWSDEDFERFNTVGIGSGGFGAFNHLDFLWIMHVMVNGCETDQGYVAKSDGCNVVAADPGNVAEDFAKLLVQHGVTIRTCETAQKVERHNDSNIICYIKTGEGSIIKRTADVVVVGTTVGSMRKIVGLNSIISGRAHNALSSIHTVDSTKCFALVNVANIPEINDPDFPKVIISDRGSHQIYVLDAAHAGKRLILYFYAWAGDSRAARNRSAAHLFAMAKKTAKHATRDSPYRNAWLKMLNQVEGDLAIKQWGDDEYARNGFTMPLPGQNKLFETLTLYWRHVLENRKKGGYAHLCGDFFGMTGGWIEGSLMNAATIASAEFQAHGICNASRIAPCNVIKRVFSY